MTGRKRHLLVDTQGSILATVGASGGYPGSRRSLSGVGASGGPDNAGCRQLWADAAYRGGVCPLGHGRVGLDHHDRTPRSGHGRLRGPAPGAGWWNAPLGGWAAGAG